ncbi:hypothetical protein, partial [Paraburkholderia sp. NMBU_R16]|uniref:hypothetical protein n=1 Tax=Paraburkholderia sp. NMBU_R16 TaxID=2698676 RepID=UPI001C26AF7A
GLGFLQKPDDLLFRKTLLHVRLLLRKRTLLGSDWPGLLGAGHPRPHASSKKDAESATRFCGQGLAKHGGTQHFVLRSDCR